MHKQPTLQTKAAEVRGRANAKRRERSPSHRPLMADLYRRAEAQLRKQPKAQKSGPKPSKPAAGPERLLHELQVHQVELELQNEELRKARDEMEAGRDKYTDLYDFAPIGYLTIDRDGTIAEANLAGASLLRVARAALAKRRFGAFVSPADRPLFAGFLQQLFKSKAREECDVRLLLDGADAVVVRIRAVVRSSGQACQLAITDITAHNQAEDKVRVSEIRYRRLFETAHDGVLLLDPATRKITDANPFMTALLGYSHEQFVGKELFEIGLLKDEAASREMFQKLRRDQEVRYEDLPLKSKTGRHQEVEVLANLYQENGHAVIQCNLRDITARKRAEDALRQSEAFNRSIVESSLDCIMELDREGKLISFLHGAQELLGIDDVRPYLNKSWTGFWRGRHRQAARTAVKKAAAGGEGKFVGFFRTLRGEPKWWDVAISPILNPQGHSARLLAVSRDITASRQAMETQRRVEVLAASNQKLEQEIIRRQAVEKSLKGSEQNKSRLLVQSHRLQEQLRQLSRQILTAQEEERREISRELHDVIAQTLTGINVRLSALKQEAARNTKSLDRNIARTQRLVEKSVEIVHEFARELRPSVLDDVGLIPALQAYLKSFTTRTGVRTHLTASAEVEKMENSQRTALYRVAQEALTNVGRHAKASRVDVIIRKLTGGICMRIKDDGKSFDAERVLRTTGKGRLGLLGMRERVEMVGGKFTVESAPGKGTTIVAHLPLGKVARGGALKPRRKML